MDCSVMIWWLRHFPGWQCQDLSGSSCERVEHEDAWVSGSFRSHFHTWISHNSVLTLTPLKVFGVKGKDWRNGSTLLSSIQTLGQKLMQLWMEINVTLHKVVETVPQQMPSVGTGSQWNVLVQRVRVSDCGCQLELSSSDWHSLMH